MPWDKPRILLTDNGSEFKNENFEKFCTAFHIKQHFCVPHHPQSDGVVERFNRTLIALLKAYVAESGADWPNFLQKVVAAYNSVEHPLKGISPYAALMKLEKPAGLFSVKHANEVCDPNEFVQFREWMREYSEATNEWGDHSANASRKGKPGYKVGDLVWCLDYSVQSKKGQTKHKLMRRWCGPWVVTATWGNVILSLKRIGGTNQIRRAHTDQVKPFVVGRETPRELKRRNEPPRPSKDEQTRVIKAARKLVDGDKSQNSSDASDNEDGDDNVFGDDQDYVVEAIVGHFHTTGGFWFLVQWEGYSQPTWEHESLIQAPQLITRYFHTVSQNCN
jgi:hypothetical protein